MALAGHGVVVRCADTDIAGDAIDGIKQIDWGRSADLLDTTDFADGQDRERGLVGIRDLEISLSGDYEASDTGQARLRTNFESGAAVWVRFLPNGTAGFKAPFKVGDFKINVSFDGTVEFSATLSLDAETGAVGTV